MSQKLKLNKLRDNLPEKIDIFVCSSSFESRCLSIPMALSEIPIGRTVIFGVKEFQDYSDKNSKVLMSNFNSEAVSFLSNKDPIVSADTIASSLHDLGSSNGVVLVDISTFTRENLLILLKYFHLYREKFGRVIFVYATAESMSDAWLSRGVENIRPVIGYSGELTPSKSLHLLIIQGFEVDRAIAAIEHLEPSHISIGYGTPDQSISDNLAKKNQQFVNELKGYCESSYEQFTMNLFDVDIGKLELKTHIAKFNKYNNVILPLNTKISTLAAALLAQEDESIQICYTQMLDYNINDYSVTSDECYVMDLF